MTEASEVFFTSCTRKPTVGGIETFSFTVGEAMQRLGHEVVLFGGAPKPGRSHRPTSLTLELHPYWRTCSIPDLGTRFQRLVQRVRGTKARGDDGRMKYFVAVGETEWFDVAIGIYGNGKNAETLEKMNPDVKEPIRPDTVIVFVEEAGE